MSVDTQNGRVVFGCASNSWQEIAHAPVSITASQSCHLKIQAENGRFKIFVGNSATPAIDATDDRFTSGMVGVRNYCRDGDQSTASFSRLQISEQKE